MKRMKFIGCIVARTASTRLPKKVLREIKGKTLIEYLIEKVTHSRNLDEIYLCTSIDDDDRILIEIAEDCGIKAYAGSREAPIKRLQAVADKEGADFVAHITGDNPHTDEIFLDKMINEARADPSFDYFRTEHVPYGLTPNLIRVSALNHCLNTIDPNKSEYLTIFIFNPDIYKCKVIIPEEALRTEYCGLTVDTPEQFSRTELIIGKLYEKGRLFYDDIIALANNEGIPHFKMDPNVLVKMPDDQRITLSQFRHMMMERVDKSKKVFLEDGYYEAQKSI